MPDSGQVAGLITAVIGVVEEAVVGCAAHEVSWVSGSGPGRKRIRLNRKTPAHLVVSMVQSRPRVWKRLRHVEHSSFSLPDPKRSVVIRMMGDVILLRSGLGWGNSLGLCAGPRLQACMIVLLASLL